LDTNLRYSVDLYPETINSLKIMEFFDFGVAKLMIHYG